MSNSSHPELDALFADAMRAENRFPSRPAMKNARPEPEKKISTLERYSLPEYWHPGRILALVHEGSHTVLGTFQEYSHKTEKGARKLLRVEAACAIAGIEYVQDDAWLGLRREEIISEPQSWTSERQVIIPDLLLQGLGVHAELVEVLVKLKFGGIYRVELISHTTFHSPDAGTALTLPAGTNVLEVMALEAKVELRKELSA